MSRDWRVARDCMTRVCGTHELKIEGQRPLSFEQAVDLLGPQSTAIGCLAYGTDVTVQVDAESPLNCYSISLPLAGQQELRMGGRRYLSDAEVGLVVAPTARQDLSISGDCRKLLLAIDRRALRGALEQMLGRRVDKDIEFEPLMPLDRGEALSWWRMVRVLWDDLGQPASLCAHGAMSGGLEDAVIRGLLSFQPHNFSSDVHQMALGHMPAHVAKMRTFLVENARENLCAEDLDGVGGVSPARMTADFRKHTGQTPLQFLRRYRLEQARQWLVSAANTQSVSAVALEWGFTHLGRFSQEYRETFGESPSATVNRHKMRRH